MIHLHNMYDTSARHIMTATMTDTNGTNFMAKRTFHELDTSSRNLRRWQKSKVRRGGLYCSLGTGDMNKNHCCRRIDMISIMTKAAWNFVREDGGAEAIALDHRSTEEN